MLHDGRPLKLRQRSGTFTEDDHLNVVCPLARGELDRCGPHQSHRCVTVTGDHYSPRRLQVDEHLTVTGCADRDQRRRW